MKFGIVIFPGTTCEWDCFYVLKEILRINEVEFLWYDEFSKLYNFDGVILPGGFSYGDYLRPGAIASAVSRVVENLYEFGQKKNKVILGICNGFQILTEAGLLPGALIKNITQKFICKYIYLLVENRESIFTCAVEKDILRLPIAHMDGNYQVDDASLHKLIKNKQILLRYCDASGNVSEDANPNGSVYNIAGITNEMGNVAGMMPHPERACEKISSSTDGLLIFKSIIKSLS